MSEDFEHVFEAALGLPPEARAALAGTLLDSLDASVDESVEEAWGQEIARRIEALDGGSARTVSWAEARRQILG